MNKIHLSNTKYFSFEGGGGKGIAYLGAVKGLEHHYGGVGKPLVDLKATNFHNLNETEAKKRIETRYNYQFGSSRGEKAVLGVSGSSAGAIIAYMIAMGMNSVQMSSVFNEIREGVIWRPIRAPIRGVAVPKMERLSIPDKVPISYFEQLIDDDFQKQPQTRIWESVKESVDENKLGTIKYSNYKAPLQLAYLQAHGFLDLVKGFTGSSYLLDKLTDAYLGRNIYSFLHERGILSGVKARTVLGDIMQKYLLNVVGEKSKSPESITFGKFFRLTGIDLVITGSNISTGKPKIFSAFHTRDFPVIEAVSISINLPFIFKPVMIDAIVHNGGSKEYNDAYRGLYVDGGLVNNLPFRLFNTLGEVELSEFENAGKIYLSAYNYDNTADEMFSKQNWTVAFDLVDNSFQPRDTKSLFGKGLDFSFLGLSGGLLDTVLYSSGEGQFRTDEERNNRIKVDATGLSVNDFASPEVNIARGDKYEYQIEVLDEVIDTERSVKTLTGSTGRLKNVLIEKAYDFLVGRDSPFIN